MIAAEDTVLVLLAAGKSVRFGGERSKLDEPLNGLPLGLHAAVALTNISFQKRVAIVSRCQLDYAAYGFAVIANDDPIADMASSLRLGVAAARGAHAVVIALADMPRVTAALVGRLLQAAEGRDAVVTASDGNAPRPPALFGCGRFDTLAEITGDRGARALLRSGRHVLAAPEELVDVDTPAELEQLRR
jgi:molybdenum cofactor cytidylyltransferase